MLDLRTHHNFTLVIRTDSVNNWKGEFAFCEVFCKPLIVIILDNIFKFLSSGLDHKVRMDHECLKMHCNQMVLVDRYWRYKRTQMASLPLYFASSCNHPESGSTPQ